MEELNWKRKKVEKCVKNELEIECFKYGGKVTLHLNVPKRKRERKKKVIQVTWSDSESNRTSENESNE